MSQLQHSAIATSAKSSSSAWYRPIISPDHGVYVVLIVAFLTGAAVAQRWTISTTLALICAFLGFQAEHPLVLQIKQRKSWKPRFLVWGGIYASVAIAIASYLAFQAPILLWIYAGAIAAFLIDVVSVFRRQQKSIFNEFMTFAAVCLTVPFAEAATIGTISPAAIGLWILNTLFFASAIFTVKLRKPKTASLTPAAIYHAIAASIVLGLWLIGWISPVTAAAFVVVLFKFSLIVWQQNWYCTAKIQQVAMLETTSAILFLAIASLSVLPAHLSAGL